jgi:hypothetical protein
MYRGSRRRREERIEREKEERGLTFTSDAVMVNIVLEVCA